MRAEWEQLVGLPGLCPSDLAVQGMFKVIINCSNIILMPLFLVTSLKLSYVPALLKHGSLSFGFIPEIKTEVD